MTATELLILTVLLIGLLIALAVMVVGLAMVTSGSGDKPSEPGKAATPHPLAPLDHQWRIERLVYRHHRWSGLLIVAAACFFYWQAASVSLLLSGPPPGPWGILWWVVVVGNGANLAIGVVIFARPSRLKSLERQANRWYSLDRTSTGRPILPRQIRGLAFALAGAICVAGFASLLAERLGNGTF